MIEKADQEVEVEEVMELAVESEVTRLLSLCHDVASGPGSRCRYSYSSHSGSQAEASVWRNLCSCSALHGYEAEAARGESFSTVKLEEMRRH